jgi:adenosine deaminase
MSDALQPGQRELGGERALRLQALIADLPKIELHRHLPGSIRTQTFLDLADEYGFELPVRTVEGLQPYVQVMPDTPADLGHILRGLGDFQRRLFISPAALSRLTFEMVEDAHREGIIYLEVRFSPLTMAGDALTFEEVMEGIRDGLARARVQYPVQTSILLGMTRTADLETCARIAGLASDLAAQQGDVVGVDLSGDEAAGPAGGFVDLFRQIRADERLGITVHAGEAAGPESVRDAVELLGAQRIGHGVRAILDPDVVRLVRERNVVLETCPISNVLTGAVPRLEDHPLPQFLRAGVAATINSDDPAWFDSTLDKEYYLALTTLGLSFAELQQAAVNACEGAFLPPAERTRLRQTVERAYGQAASQFEAL